MVSSVKLIEGTKLTAAPALYYTAPAATQTIVKKITVVNIDPTNAHAVTIWFVASGGTAVSSQLLVDARPIGPLATYDVTEAQNHVLAPGDTIWAEADDATNLQIQASGVQIV
ncbi:MAG TPA: hypothetical protein VN754_10560 [Candidatus Binataceae bacterium]|nr:hypothetical protein [Candidatus Binataceae bacterium]